MYTTFIPRQVITGIVVCFSVLLLGCDSSDSSSIANTSNTPALNDPSNTGDIGLASVAVPEAYISYEDGSATLAAVRNGVDVKTRLIDTSFSCYDDDASDYLAPYLSFTVTANRFVSTFGQGTIDYEPKRGDFILNGGGFEDDEYTYLHFDSFGQRFSIDTGEADVACFQHGASLERALHRFLLNTPEVGDYMCTEVQTNEQHALRFSEGGRYQTAEGAGIYVVSDFIDSSRSQIDFIQGPLDGEDVSYRENPNTGRQEFRFSNTRVFGLGAGSSSSLTFVCARNREPRPFKQYGFAAATAASPPNVALNGMYYTEDVQLGVNHSYLHAKYYNFRSDGFMRRDYPGIIPDDCNRTAPNGLNYCDSYDVNAGDLFVFEPTGKQRKMGAIQITSNGTVTKISDDGMELVTGTDSPYIEGTWLNNEYRQIGCVGLGFCSSSYTERTYVFATDGRFAYYRSGQNTSSAEIGEVSSHAFANASNDSTGSYEIRGNRLLLQFLDGTLENRFIYKSGNGNLAINGLLYIDDTE